MIDPTLIDQLNNHVFKVEDVDNAKFWLSRYIKFLIAYDKAHPTILHDWNNEVHHIVPISWGGNERKFNTINLSFKAHMIAHHLLYRTKDKSMIIAMHGMTNRRHKGSVNNIFLNDSIKSIQKSMALAKRKIHEIYNLETHELTTNWDIAAKYNDKNTAVMGCIKSGTRYKGYHYQLKEIVDKSSCEAEL